MPRPERHAVVRAALTLFAVAWLSACASPDARPITPDPQDPLEEQNRAVFEFNRHIDRALLRPAAKGYVAIVPEPVVVGINNFSENLSLPSAVVNKLLQGDAPGAAHNTLRFLINSTVGIGGLFDPAGAGGLYEQEADFGQTLHVWGVPEGDFLMLPVFGPSNTRDAAGIMVDFFTNPLRYTLSPETSNIRTAARVLEIVGDRGRYAETVDSVIYESADGYAQSRSIYQQNRRFQLGGRAEDAYLDPYEDPYEDPYDE